MPDAVLEYMSFMTLAAAQAEAEVIDAWGCRYSYLWDEAKLLNEAIDRAVQRVADAVDAAVLQGTDPEAAAYAAAVDEADPGAVAELKEAERRSAVAYQGLLAVLPPELRAVHPKGTTPS